MPKYKKRVEARQNNNGKWNQKKEKSFKEASKDPMSTWKKYEFPETHMQAEENDPYMHLVETQYENILRNKVNEQRGLALTEGEDWSVKYWNKKLKDFEFRRIKSKINQEFIDDFILWVQGRSKYNQKKVTLKKVFVDDDGQIDIREFSADGTPWGNKPLHHVKGVDEFLEQAIDRRSDTVKRITKLKLYGPRNINEAYLYYKYIVRRLAIDKNTIKEFEEFAPFDFPVDENGNMLEIETAPLPARYEKIIFDSFILNLEEMARAGMDMEEIENKSQKYRFVHPSEVRYKEALEHMMGMTTDEALQMLEGYDEWRNLRSGLYEELVAKEEQYKKIGQIIEANESYKNGEIPEYELFYQIENLVKDIEAVSGVGISGDDVDAFIAVIIAQRKENFEEAKKMQGEAVERKKLINDLQGYYTYNEETGEYKYNKNIEKGIWVRTKTDSPSNVSVSFSSISEEDRERIYVLQRINDPSKRLDDTEGEEYQPKRKRKKIKVIFPVPESPQEKVEEVEEEAMEEVVEEVVEEASEEEHKQDTSEEFFSDFEEDTSSEQEENVVIKPRGPRPNPPPGGKQDVIIEEVPVNEPNPIDLQQQQAQMYPPGYTPERYRKEMEAHQRREYERARNKNPIITPIDVPESKKNRPVYMTREEWEKKYFGRVNEMTAKRTAELEKTKQIPSVNREPPPENPKKEPPIKSAEELAKTAHTVSKDLRGGFFPNGVIKEFLELEDPSAHRRDPLLNVVNIKGNKLFKDMVKAMNNYFKRLKGGGEEPLFLAYNDEDADQYLEIFDTKKYNTVNAFLGAVQEFMSISNPLIDIDKSDTHPNIMTINRLRTDFYLQYAMHNKTYKLYRSELNRLDPKAQKWSKNGDGVYYIDVEHKRMRDRKRRQYIKTQFLTFDNLLMYGDPDNKILDRVDPLKRYMWIEDRRRDPKFRTENPSELRKISILKKLGKMINSGTVIEGDPMSYFKSPGQGDNLIEGSVELYNMALRGVEGMKARIQAEESPGVKYKLKQQLLALESKLYHTKAVLRSNLAGTLLKNGESVDKVYNAMLDMRKDLFEDQDKLKKDAEETILIFDDLLRQYHELEKINRENAGGIELERKDFIAQNEALKTQLHQHINAVNALRDAEALARTALLTEQAKAAQEKLEIIKKNEQEKQTSEVAKRKVETELQTVKMKLDEQVKLLNAAQDQVHQTRAKEIKLEAEYQKNKTELQKINQDLQNLLSGEKTEANIMHQRIFAKDTEIKKLQTELIEKEKKVAELNAKVETGNKASARAAKLRADLEKARKLEGTLRQQIADQEKLNQQIKTLELEIEENKKKSAEDIQMKENELQEERKKEKQEIDLQKLQNEFDKFKNDAAKKEVDTAVAYNALLNEKTQLQMEFEKGTIAFNQLMLNVKASEAEHLKKVNELEHNTLMWMESTNKANILATLREQKNQELTHGIDTLRIDLERSMSVNANLEENFTDFQKEMETLYAGMAQAFNEGTQKDIQRVLFDVRNKLEKARDILFKYVDQMPIDDEQRREPEHPSEWGVDESIPRVVNLSNISSLWGPKEFRVTFNDNLPLAFRNLFSVIPSKELYMDFAKADLIFGELEHVFRTAMWKPRQTTASQDTAFYRMNPFLAGMLKSHKISDPENFLALADPTKYYKANEEDKLEMITHIKRNGPFVGAKYDWIGTTVEYLPTYTSGETTISLYQTLGSLLMLSYYWKDEYALLNQEQAEYIGRLALSGFQDLRAHAKREEDNPINDDDMYDYTHLTKFSVPRPALHAWSAMFQGIRDPLMDMGQTEEQATATTYKYLDDPVTFGNKGLLSNVFEYFRNATREFHFVYPRRLNIQDPMNNFLRKYESDAVWHMTGYDGSLWNFVSAHKFDPTVHHSLYTSIMEHVQTWGEDERAPVKQPHTTEYYDYLLLSSKALLKDLGRGVVAEDYVDNIVEGKRPYYLPIVRPNDRFFEHIGDESVHEEFMRRLNGFRNYARSYAQDERMPRVMYALAAIHQQTFEMVNNIYDPVDNNHRRKFFQH